MTSDEELNRGALIGCRAILSAMLVEIHYTQGYEAVRRIRTRADIHATEARHRMNSEATTVEELDSAKESSSVADGFIDDAFAAAYAAELG